MKWSAILSVELAERDRKTVRACLLLPLAPFPSTGLHLKCRSVFQRYRCQDHYIDPVHTSSACGHARSVAERRTPRQAESERKPRCELRFRALPQAGAEPQEESPSLAAAIEEPKKERTPRVDWAGLLRRTFALDVFACVRCGGRRQVLAYLRAPRWGRAISEQLGLPSQAPKRAPARRPPQQAVVLGLAQPLPTTPCLSPQRRAARAAVCPKGVLGPLYRRSARPCWPQPPPPPPPCTSPPPSKRAPIPPILSSAWTWTGAWMRGWASNAVNFGPLTGPTGNGENGWG